MRLSKDDYAHRIPITGIAGAFAHYCVFVTEMRTKKLFAKEELWHFRVEIIV